MILVGRCRHYKPGVSAQAILGSLFFILVLKNTLYLLVDRLRKLVKAMGFVRRRFSLWKKTSLAGIPGLNVQLVEAFQKIFVDRLVQGSLYFRK